MSPPMSRVAKVLNPKRFRLATKPGELAFGVVAMALLGGGDSFVEGELLVYDSERLAVAEGVESFDWAEAVEERAGFLNEAVVEHLGGTEVDALVQGGAGRVEADAEEAVTGERVAAGGEGGGD